MCRNLRFLECARVAFRTALYAAFMIAAPAFAADHRNPSAAGPGSGPIGNGDLLRVLVNAEENLTAVLSGDFRVGSDGSINYPVLGKVIVTGMDEDGLAEHIRGLLADQVPITGTPTILVAEYAPVFLLGNVHRTGPIEFQPGLTVLQLILQAGGLPQPDELDAQLLAAGQEVLELELLSFSLGAQRARLLAEIRGEDFNTGPFDGHQLSESTGIVANEVAIFSARRRAREAQASVFDRQRANYDQEISSLEETIALHDEEVRLLEEEMATQAGLSERGLVAKSRLSEIKRELAGTKRQGLEFRTALYQARQGRLSVDQNVTEAEIAAETLNLDTFREVEIELHRTDLKLETARTALEQIQRRSNVSQNTFGQVPTYTLIRPVEGSYEVAIVDELAELARGDIVRVDFTNEIQAPLETPKESRRTIAGTPD
jgi:polysaccharide export outer membrane protein